MGFSASVAIAILIVGIVGVTLVAYPILEKTITDISGALKERGMRQGSKQETVLQVINITVNGTCSSYNLTVLLNNTGSRGVRVSDISVFDNNLVLNLSNSTTTVKFFSSDFADGGIDFRAAYNVNATANTSNIALNRTLDGALEESRSYLSFDTSSIPDGAKVVFAKIVTDVYVYRANGSVTYNVNYYSGNKSIGDSLTSGAWGNFTYIGLLNYGGTTGYKNFIVANNAINKFGDTDFELRPGWAVAILGRWNNITIIQSETSNRPYTPFLFVTYQRPNATSDILAPTKDINMVYNRLNSTAKRHTLVIVAESGATAYGYYECT